MPLRGRTEIAVQVHLHGGPNDGLIEEGSLVNGDTPPPIYSSSLQTEEGRVGYAYHLSRVVEPKDGPPQVHYRYID